MRRIVSLAVAAMVVTGSVPAGAGAPAQDETAALNAGYERGLAFGITPQTVGEMLHCSAMWDRWHYVVESAADPAFKQGLRKELSASNAKARKLHWQRMARREMREDDDTAYFEGSRADAESRADKHYADYMTGSERGRQVMTEYLAVCK
tara:strand:+ start:2556 stop:3005 length:450 start_codon:yes stop_codon:yes gene_type:complete